MKKVILGAITCLLSLGVFGQVNEFKFGFPLRANGGLNVGTDKVQLDSIVRDGTTIKFYTGVTELLPNMAGGSVTSVGMTVPTGLSITGSPITSSGTLGLTFAPGYSIPSDASQSNWNTAYNWGDHVLGGYQSQSDILDAFAALTNSSGVLTNNGSGGLTWTAVGGTGTVTSVALSVPTGLSVTGSPITSSGTLAISLASGYSIPSTSVQSNWTTAYIERAQWDGGSTNLVASTGRTSLGATTVGSNLFTLNNPNAIRFIQINANNTVSALTAADLKTALSLTASDVSLGNVTNESKTTMFTSPIFTGVAPRLGSPVTDTVATRDNIRSSISALLSGGIQLSDVAVMKEDTLTSSGIYYTQRQVDSIIATITGVSLTDVRNEIADSINKIRAESIPGLAEADTADLVATQHYVATHGGSSWDSAYIHYRVDSLSTVVDAQATEIENLWNALALLGDMDIIAPRFESAELGSFADDTLVVLMDTTDVRQDSVPPLTAFTLWAGATEHGIASVDIGHDTLYIALDSTGVYGATYTLDYTRGTPALQDSSGNKTSSWIGRSVTNNIAEPSDEPSFLASDGNTDFRYVAESQYITMATGVSQWQDISGSGWHLAQATGTAQPAFSEATGVSFDGTSDFLRNNSVAVSAPWTIYIVANITYAQFSTFFYFNELGSDRLYSMMPDEVNPTMELGSIAQNYVTNTWYVWTITMDGANSSIQLNDGTPTVASYTNAAIDLLSFASFEGSNWGNLRIKEVIGRAGADTAPNKSAVITYLMNKYAIE